MPLFGYRNVKPSDDDEPAVEPDTTGLDKIGQWRYEQFLALEFTPFSSVMLVELGADYRQAERLLERNPDHAWVFDQLT